jgi:predicted Fe-Mo cluster-binding NifX family protein
MKIAISTGGSTLDDEVEPRFGRTPNFLIVDSENNNTSIINNTQAIESVNGAGIQSAERVVRLGAEVVLTGHCGPKAFRTLNSAGVKIVTGVSGTVRQALEKFNNGEYEISSSADVDSHW